MVWVYGVSTSYIYIFQNIFKGSKHRRRRVRRNASVFIVYASRLFGCVQKEVKGQCTYVYRFGGVFQLGRAIYHSFRVFIFIYVQTQCIHINTLLFRCGGKHVFYRLPIPVYFVYLRLYTIKVHYIEISKCQRNDDSEIFVYIDRRVVKIWCTYETQACDRFDFLKHTCPKYSSDPITTTVQL